jgi:PAS domain S-box-containing protein
VSAPTPPNEAARAAAVERYELLDTMPEQAYDDLARLAAVICETPTALVTLVHGDRQWLKARFGATEGVSAARVDSFCAYAIGAPQEVLVINDTLHDPRFMENPMVRGAPGIRFYAGAPLVTADGHALGTVCVIDQQPRQVTAAQREALQALARQAQAQMELRRTSRELERRNEALAGEMADRTARALELERLADIVEHSPNGIISTTLDAVVLSWNPGAESLYGYRAAEVLGKSLTLIVPPDRAPEFEAMLGRLRAGERISGLQTVRRRKDGGLRDVSIHGALVGQASGTPAISWIASDETERRAAERVTRDALDLQLAANAQLERTNTTKSNFVSVVSHEFRTPLTVIQGFAQMLATEEFAADETREYAQDIYEEASRLGRLISDMLDLDRMESGRMELARRPVDVNAVFREAAERQAGGRRGHRLVLALDERLPPVEGDPDRLQQVAVNLVSNAFKYSPRGGEVHVATARDGGAVRVTVSDQGLGIDAGSLETIFDRYARSGSTRDQAIQGTGLGLPIVREIVQLHGGRVWAESGPGAGSTFHVVLPVGPTADPGRAGPASG